jgi:hypothetical protein
MVNSWPNRAAEARPVNIVAMVLLYFFKMVSAYLQVQGSRSQGESDTSVQQCEQENADWPMPNRSLSSQGNPPLKAHGTPCMHCCMQIHAFCSR